MGIMYDERPECFQKMSTKLNIILQDLFYLLEKQSDGGRDNKRDLQPAVSLLKWPPWLELDKAKAKTLKLLPVPPQ